MKKTYIDSEGKPFEIDLQPHNISNYDILFHVTLKTRKQSIEEKGLLRKQEPHKSLIETDLIFLSYPIEISTADCFRWNDERYALVILDAKKLKEDGFIFYDDYFGQQDANSKGNHICCDVDIPKEYIKKILEW